MQKWMEKGEEKERKAKRQIGPAIRKADRELERRQEKFSKEASAGQVRIPPLTTIQSSPARSSSRPAFISRLRRQTAF